MFRLNPPFLASYSLASHFVVPLCWSGSTFYALCLTYRLGSDFSLTPVDLDSTRLMDLEISGPRYLQPPVELDTRLAWTESRFLHLHCLVICLDFIKPALPIAVLCAGLRYSLHGRAGARNMNAGLEVNDVREIDARLRIDFFFVMPIAVVIIHILLSSWYMARHIPIVQWPLPCRK